MNENDYQITFKTTPRQLDFAQRVADSINQYAPEANAIVKNTNGFITVEGFDSYRSWLFKIGVRCAIVNLYTKKSVHFTSAQIDYNF